MRTKITVVIPTVNNEEGIKYLKIYFKNKGHEIVIVDNSKKNLGFAGGVNKGAADAKTKWLLILNDDIEFKKKFQISNPKSQNQNLNLKANRSEKIEELIEFAEENKLDAVTPVLINPDGKIENVGYKILSYGRVKLAKELTSLRVNELDGITAACLLIKTSVFKKLKGFDERFFAYLEDVDLFLRFKRAGYKMGVARDIEVLHNHMTTSKTMGNFKARQDMINWWRLYFKHPDKFKFNLEFIVERLRNVSGFIKATFIIKQ